MEGQNYEKLEEGFRGENEGIRETKEEGPG